LDMICAKQAVSKFVCRELYRFFVHGDIDATVESEVIEPLAELFRDNADSPDQMRIVMEALLTSEHFFTADIRGCRIKSPVDLLIGSLRTFGMPMPDPSLPEARYHVWNSIYSMVEAAGQSIADPPNVAGWPAYYLYPTYDRAWMDTASYPARRKKLLDLNNLGLATPSTLYDPGSRDLEFTFDLVAFVQQFSDPTNPDTLIDEAAELLFGVSVSAAVKEQLKNGILLGGQSADHYWTDAYEAYVADPDTDDPEAQMVPTILRTLFADMLGAAEHHLH
jgi:Protein of unknown function (DUF1800)